jgi:hypothetical protein
LLLVRLHLSREADRRAASVCLFPTYERLNQLISSYKTWYERYAIGGYRRAPYFSVSYTWLWQHGARAKLSLSDTNDTRSRGWNLRMVTDLGRSCSFC